MEHYNEYLGLLVMAVFAVGITGAMYTLNAMMGPRRKSKSKSQPFECGVQSFHSPGGSYSVKFYIFGMFFILFDVEIVLLFPWAVLLKELGWMGLIEMFVFLAVVILGFVYAWKKGALEWEK
jgi:NADH-quinone oxidoreductase subunit A